MKILTPLLIITLALNVSAAAPLPLPMADISSETNRHAVIAAGTLTRYEGHPTSIKTTDGRVITVWCAPHGGGCGWGSESSDGGKTWTRIDSRFPAEYRDHVNCPSIYRLTGPDGKDRLWIWSQSKRRANDKPGDFHSCRRDLSRSMPSIMSEDEGRTWREFPPLGEKFACVMTFASIVRLKDGSYLGVFHIGPEGRDKPPLRVLQSITRDGGFTWSDPVEICVVEGRNPCEPYVFRSPDNNELCCIMRENTHKDNSLMMFSHDEGKTWSKAEPTPWGLTGDRHQGLQLPDGRLFIAFRDMAMNSPWRGHFVAWVGTYEELKTGKIGNSYRIKLLHHCQLENPKVKWNNLDSGYPGLAMMDDGTIIATTYLRYWPDKRMNSVVATRLTISEMDKRIKLSHPPSIATSPTT